MTVVHNIPTIDIGPYVDSQSPPEARSKVIDQVKTACSTYGFLQITGHGVPLETQRTMLHCCGTLFDLPQEQKDALSLKTNPARRWVNRVFLLIGGKTSLKLSRGYERLGEQVLDAKALPDYKEGFYIGREVSANDTSFLRGPNQWPDLPIATFHTPVTEYYTHMLRLSNNLLEMLAIGLGHDPSVLTAFTREPVVNLKLLHYPPHTSTNKRQFGAGAHTDFGTLTILLQQPGKHGLQVYYAPTEEWLSVPAIEDVFVINMGDLIQKWTDGEYSSTVHRVINAADGDRYSVPCFFQGDLSATNPFKPEQRGGGETVEEHIRRKFDLSYGLKEK